MYRNLTHNDAAIFREHLLRLDTDARYSRFSIFMSDVAIIQYIDKINWSFCDIIGYFEDNNGVLRGTAEIRYSNDLSNAECSFSVEPTFQNRGYGTTLMNKTLETLYRRGVKCAYVICRQTNRRMRHITAKYTNNITIDSGECFSTIQLAA